MKRRTRNLKAAKGAILVKRLEDRRYRATSTFFTDCEAVAATAEAAQEAVAEAVDRLLRERVQRECRERNEAEPPGSRSQAPRR